MKTLQGAAAGFAATVPMTLTMQALRAGLPRERWRRMPPREIIDRTVDKTGTAPAVDREARIFITAVGHFAFGALAGAVYGAMVGSRRSSPWKGVAFGLAVWAVSYGVVLPLMGLHAAADEDTTERNLTLAASHVVWGATLGKLV